MLQPKVFQLFQPIGGHAGHAVLQRRGGGRPKDYGGSPHEQNGEHHGHRDECVGRD